jgi:signal transduction histidine kinase
MRAHPMFGDTMIAAAIGVLDVPLSSESSFASLHAEAFWVVAVLMLGPLVFRRRNPVISAYLIVFGGFVQIGTHGSLNDEITLAFRPADLALAVSLYTLVAYVGRRQATAYAAFLVIGTGLWAAFRIVRPVQDVMVLTIGAVMIFAFSWILGEFAGARRAYHDAVEQRVRLLETERDQQARIAVAEERTRIARELHDVVAHAVSVIVVQADGATYAIRDNPDLAEQAMRTISDTGREALTELRRLLDVLRRTDESGDADRSPQPGLAALPEMLDKVRAIGLPVMLVFRGDLAGLPAAVGLGIYRIVQEALTNTLKHGGPGTSSAVRVEQVNGQIEVEVTDDGRGTPRELAEFSGGNGLIGMRERAAVLGGTLDAGPRRSGGWQVLARFPVRSERAAPLP